MFFTLHGTEILIADRKLFPYLVMNSSGDGDPARHCHSLESDGDDHSLAPSLRPSRQVGSSRLCNRSARGPQRQCASMNHWLGHRRLVHEGLW